MGIENIRQALGALRANWVRSLLTLLIIAFGIMAVVGILTAIDAAIYSLNENFSTLGANSIEIRPQSSDLGGRRAGRARKVADPITYDQAIAFQESFSRKANVSIHLPATGSAVAKYGTEETNPTISLTGIDELYLSIKSFELSRGRAFSNNEVYRGANVAIIGNALVKELFDGKEARALGKIISIGPLRLEVVGVLVSKGSSMNNNADKMVFAPLQTIRRTYGTTKSNYGLVAELPLSTEIEAGLSDATGAMRVARGLSAKKENDFRIITSDSLVEKLKENTSKLRAGAIAIGIMTLFGAAIGLMNIMLVSVTERTREIGIAKALGASANTILLQFLTEAVVITQLGGIVGIIFGIAVGNIVAYFAGGSFLIPWGWIVLSLIVCLFTGLLSGLYPAVKASRLDPIESLRYE